jgi:hypothetical protein
MFPASSIRPTSVNVASLERTYGVETVIPGFSAASAWKNPYKKQREKTPRLVCGG